MIRAVLILLAMTLTAAADELRIGTSPDFPPYIDRIAEGFEGLDYDLISNICTEENLDCVWVAMPFNDLIGAVSQGSIDLAVGGISVTPDRAARVDFSDAYIGATRGGMFLSRPNPIRPVEEGRIAVQTGTIYDAHASEQGWTVIRFSDAKEAIRAAANGEVDYVFSSESNLRLVLDQGRTSLVAAGFTDVPSAGQAFALAKNRPDLKALINRNLDRITRSGLMQSLRQKWFSTSL